MMPKPLALFLVMLGSAFSVVCAEDAKVPTLITKVIQDVSVSILFVNDPQDPSKPHPISKPLPNMADGGTRYDVMEFFRANGLCEGNGKVAIYLPDDKSIILTATLEDHDLAERMLEPRGMIASVKALQISVSAWTYLDDPLVMVNDPTARFEQIQKAAGDSLRPLDAHVLTTRSGAQVTSTQCLAASNEPFNPTTGSEIVPLKVPGSVARIEPQIGPDGVMIDFLVEYRARIPQPNAPDLCLAFATNGTIAAGANRVAHNFLLPPIENQDPSKVRRCAIVVGARILGPDGELPKDPKERNKHLIEKALKGLPAEMLKPTEPKAGPPAHSKKD